MFDFGTKIEKFETIPSKRPFFREHHGFGTKTGKFETDFSEDLFFDIHSRILDNFILSAPSKIFLADTPMSVRNSAYSDETTLSYII